MSISPSRGRWPLEQHSSVVSMLGTWGHEALDHQDLGPTQTGLPLGGELSELTRPGLNRALQVLIAELCLSRYTPPDPYRTPRA